MLLIYGARQIGNYNYSRVFKEKQKNKLYWDKFNWNKLALETFNTSKDSEDLLLRISLFNKWWFI